MTPSTNRTFRNVISASSLPAFALWRYLPFVRSIVVRLDSGLRVHLGKGGAGPLGNDYGCAYEVFVHEFYRLPPAVSAVRDRVRNVVDLGANVGFASLYFLNAFPACRVTAIEPHPAHVAAIRRNLRLNDLEGRLVLHEAAAGNADGRARLTDRGTGSQLDSAGEIDVPIIDVFGALGSEPIDLMKIDIEGAEYAILDDPRFAQLRPRFIVMEWHGVADPPNGKEHCQRRLGELGYEMSEIFAHSDHGMFWAIRS